MDLEQAINELMKHLSSLDIMRIDDEVFIDTFEYSGLHRRWSGDDLRKLVIEIHEFFD